ncbi:PAS domain S-box protein [Peptostreptococcaceae bacterium AGR-M142]
MLKKKYENLFLNMNEGFALHKIICDEKGVPIDYKFLEVNKSFEDLTGLKYEKIKGKTIKEILPNTEDYWIKRYGEVALSGEKIIFQNYSRELKKHFKVSVYSPDKEYFVTIFSDITNQINKRNRRIEEHDLLEIILNYIADSVVVIDLYDNIILINSKAKEMLNCDFDENKYVFDEIFDIEDIENNIFISDLIQKNTIKKEEIFITGHGVLKIHQKKVISIEYTLSSIKKENNIKGFVIIFRNSK